MFRIYVTFNVTLTGFSQSTGEDVDTDGLPSRPPGEIRTLWCTGVDMSRTACGGADVLSHPGARGGLDARLGASLDPRTGLSSRIHRDQPQGRT
jgi:hypothetical protein